MNIGFKPFQKALGISFNKLNNDLQKIGLELYEPPVDGIYKFIHWRNDIRRAHKISGIKEPISSYMQVKDTNSKYIIELHKGKGGSDYDHLHITNAKGEKYDKHLNNLTAKLSKEKIFRINSM